MKTNFQANEILTASDLNSNFTECASKADANHSHGLISNGAQKVECKSTGAVEITATSVGGSAVLAGSATLTNTDVLATSKVISAALAGKAGANIKQVITIDGTGVENIAAENMEAGALYLINNLLSKSLSQIVYCEEPESHSIVYHLNSSSLTNDFFMVRNYTWQEQIEGGTYTWHLIEVVGAWNSPV